MKYPGRIIKAGEKDKDIILALKKQLNKKLANAPDLQLDPTDANFGPRMKQAIKLFQTRHVDSTLTLLKVDGEVGSLTWAALFGDATVSHASVAKANLTARALAIAIDCEKQGVEEKPPYSNSGPEVSRYLASVSLAPGHAWCCAFTYWCHQKAAEELARKNPMIKTGGCLKHWQKSELSGARRITSEEARNNPSLLKPGMLFIMDYGKGLGHTGFIESIVGGLLTTIEGNTNIKGSREGGGVHRLVRKVGDINKGFIDYSGA